MDFDENKAIEFINSNLPVEIASLYDGDDYLTVIDLIWDYYEENGLLEIDAEIDEDDDASYQEMVQYVGKMLRKDRDNKIKPEHVGPIIDAEIAYELSLEDDMS